MGANSINLSIVCVLIVLSVLWKPNVADDFKSGCKGSTSGATFANGQKYNYAVDGTVSVFVTGAEKQETNVKMVGQVSVSALGNCDYVFKVNDLTISGPDGKKYGKPNGIEKPVRFTYQDGRVGPEIQTEEGDTRRSLNIKRAIISLLQTEQKPSTQIDVFGSCPTEVSSSKEGSALLVHRSRDLSRCAHREQGKNGLLTAVYNPSSDITNTLVLQSLLNVESKVNNGVPEKVSATEEYLYKPFSVGENGARAKVHTKLTLTGKTGGADNGQFKTVRTIIFENPHGAKMDRSNFQSALAAVKDTAKTLTTEASSQSASSFVSVVKIFRVTNKDDLVKVYNQVKGNSLEKRVFLDALLRTGTGYSIEASIQILKSKELSTLEQQLVYLSLGNARHVNDEALKAATSLLDQPNLPKEIYLGVGALAGSYCRDHFCHGEKSDGIVALSQKLGNKLQNCKPKSKIEEDNVVAVLKGIRNIRHLEDSLIDKITHCAADNTVKARVRVAALEAFHADPCAAKIKKTGLDLMKNRQLDSEIRIKAYLAVIECPCGKSANEIKNLLESEPVHQVGRFITTSLRHIRSSANPDKSLARQHYGLIRTPNKFNVDDRKYSFYREASFNVDAAGVGGNVEQTVIYSQNSFLPRSASLNLTAQVFGHNLNVLEVGGRQGNLDRVVEHFLGPKSFLRTDSPQTIYDNLAKRFENAKNKVEGLRTRRSVKTELDSFDKKIKDESTPWNNELDLDIFVKLFGTDAIFLSLGDDKVFDFEKFLDQLFKNINDGMDKVKHFQQEVRGHLLFLDAELSYPTSTGLPLKLDLTGAATGRLEVATNVDIRQILKSPENAKVDVKLVPSSDIEISGVFAIDADFVLTGLKVSANLHSSTGGHIIAKVLEGGRGIDLQFGLPIEKQEILTASNDLVYITVEKGQKAKSIPIKIDSERKEYSGCFDQLSGVLGLTLCGEISVPFSVSGPEAQGSISKFLARYPLTGSSKVKLVLEKNDLRGYHIKGVLRDTNPERQSFELLFEAEGSQNRRTQLTGELVNTNEEKSVKIALESPIKSASAQISLYRKPNEYAAVVKAKLDTAEYFGRVGFNVQGNERRSVYKPVAEYQLPGEQGKQSLKIDGQIIREVNGPTTTITIDGSKIYLPNSNDVVNINGHYKEEPKNMEIDLKIKKGEQNIILSGSAKGNDYKLEFQNTLNPYINFRAEGHFETGETIRNDIDIYYGEDLRNAQNHVCLNQLLKYRKVSAEDFSLITKNKVEVHAIPLKIKVEAEVDPKKIDIEVEGQYMEKKAEFDLEARTQIKKPGDYSIKVKAGANKQGIEAFAKRDIVSPEKSNLENYIQIKNFGKYELSGVVLHKTKPNDVNVGAIGHLKITGGSKSEDIKFDIGVIENSKVYSSHAKISGSKGDIVDYLLKINRGDNPNGQLKLILKDTIAANGQFQVTDSEGKGNGLLIVDFKKIQRKIKGEVKFVVKDPTYNADVDVFMNFEKDNNDKVHFNTKTKRTDTLIDSKNAFEYAGKKTQVNVHQDGTIDLVSKVNAKVEIILPTDRLLSLRVNRDMKEKDNVYNGQAEIILLDDDKHGGGPSSITYKAKLINCNFEKDVINYEGQVEIKLNNGKQLQNVFYIKNIPEGDNVKLEFKTDLTGNLIPKPASLSATMDYTSPETVDGSESYRVKGSYGSDISFELVGKGELKFFDKGEKKYVDEETLTLRLPFENAHDIKVVSNVIFTQPDNNDVIAEYTVIESVQVNSDVYKVEASGRVGMKNGFGKVKILVPHVDPISFDANYNGDFESEKKTASVEVKSVYGKGKTASIIIDAVSVPQDNNIRLRINAPDKVLSIGDKLDIKWHAKNPAPDTYNTNVVINADGREYYKSDSQIVYSKANPLIDIKFNSAHSTKPGRIYIKGNSLGSTHAKGQVKVENVREINFDVSSEVNIQKDSVAFKFNGDSDSFGLKHYVLDISSKDSSNGKRLEFRASNDNKDILSGSTSFISKQEGPKTIIEGSGSVKVKNDQKSANFKYIRTVLTEGNEQGIETFLNLALGESSYVAETRVTNLEYKTSYVYCEEKKQCAHAELNSKINVQKAGVVQHVLTAGLDLRKLGFAPEFGLESFSEVAENKLPQYKLDLHVSKEDKKYHLHVYSQPEYGKFPAGITVTLPQRVLAWETLTTYPTDKALPFPIRGQVEFHMDKNKPQQKTAVRFFVDVTGDSKQHSAVAEVGFSHPKIGKEAVAKFRGSLNTPSENNYKIESVASLSHPTLGSDRQSKVLLEINPVHVKILVDTPVVKVIDFEGGVTLKDNLQQGDVKFSVLQSKPVQIRAIVKDFQYYEFTSGYSDDAERKLSIIGHLEPEKRVDISADIVLPGEKKNIIHGALYLQDNLVKSDYGISKENFNYFVSALKKDLDSLESRIKNLGEKASNDFKNTMKRVEPTLQQLQNAYKEDFEKLYKELANDKVLKEISEAMYEIYHFVAKIIVDIIDVTKPLVDKICETIKVTAQKIVELFEKKIEPELKELYTNIAAVVRQYLDGLIDVVAHFAALVTDFFEKHKPELEELTNTIAEIFKDVTRLVVAQLKEFRAKAAEFLSDFAKQINELPIIAVIKERWQELAVPEQVFALLHEAHTAVRQLLPTEETRTFIDHLYNYVQKKLRQEKIDDVAELRVVYEKFALAFASVIQFVRDQLNQLGVPNLVNVNSVPFFSGPAQTALPSFSGSASFSLLNQFIKGDLPDPLALVKAYRPRSVNPLDEIPSKLRAVVVNGQHIFTFDGRHLTFPGNCRYVLVHDFVDRNFSLVLQLQNGLPKSLILEDKSGTTIELKENGQVVLNGANHGYPVNEKDIYAFRQTNGRIGLGSRYGLITFCTSKLEVCYIEVSGFYLGKLRGLLGDGNNEPYDDFTLPNGKITTSESDFGNAYRLATSCPQVKTPEHSMHQHHAALPAACEQVFGGSSPLRPLALVLEMSPFRQACIHAVTADSTNALQQACDLGRGYAALALTGMLPAVMPSVCMRCTDAGTPKEVGDTYELKLPAKQADIVINVEMTKSNEKNFKELVVPLVAQVVGQLKGKHIDDIKVYLLGITPRYPHPILYDTDLKLANAKVQFDQDSRYEELPTIKTGFESIDRWEQFAAGIISELKNSLGLTNTVAGYRSVLDLPLRPGAVKHTINVVGEHCKSQFFLVEALRSITFDLIFKENAYTHSLVIVTPDISIGGGKNAAQIVGFTDDIVLMLGDKKQSKDAETLRSTMEIPEDSCIDFTRSTDGIVFSASNFQKLNPGQQKQFLQTSAHAISQKLLKETLVQECTCAYVDPFRVRSVCQNKERKEQARRRK